MTFNEHRLRSQLATLPRAELIERYLALYPHKAHAVTPTDPHAGYLVNRVVRAVTLLAQARAQDS